MAENMIKKRKKVLILGGSSDIGSEVSKFFLNNNWEVTCHYFKNKIFKKKNKNIKFIQYNFLKKNYKTIDKELNKKFNDSYDSVINLVGFINNKTYTNMNYEDLVNSLQVNTLVPIFIERQIVKKMLKQKWGRILNCGSIGIKYGGGPSTFCYSFSKHSLEFMPSIYKIWSKKNVLINNVRIGVTDTKLHKKIRGKNLKKRIKLIPIGRMATKTEIAKFIYNLSSENNTYITGETLSISGGE